MTRLLHIVVSLVILSLLSSFPATAAGKKTEKPAFSDQTTAKDRPLAVLSDVKHWSNPDYTRISLELDRDVAWEAHELGKGSPDKPGRVYIDINRAKLGKGVKDIIIGDGLLKGVRLGQFRQDVVRVVLDTKNIKDYKIFPLSEPARLIIDVRGERRARYPALKRPSPPGRNRRWSLSRNPRRRPSWKRRPGPGKNRLSPRSAGSSSIRATGGMIPEPWAPTALWRRTWSWPSA